MRHYLRPLALVLVVVGTLALCGLCAQVEAQGVPPVLNMQHPLNQGLVGWWKAIATLANPLTVYDLTPFGDHGTVAGYASTASCGFFAGGTPRGALWRWTGGNACNGAAEMITMAAASVYNFERTDKFTLAVWVNSVSVRGQNLLQKNGGATSPGYLLMVQNGSGKPALRLITAASELLEYQGPSAISDSTWHQIVGTYSGTSDITGYGLAVDGQVVAGSTSASSNTSTLTATMTSSSQLATGQGGNYIDGSIADIRIWRRVLTATEIAQLYVLSLQGDTELLQLPGAEPDTWQVPLAAALGGFFEFMR